MKLWNLVWLFVLYCHSIQLYLLQKWSWGLQYFGVSTQPLLHCAALYNGLSWPCFQCSLVHPGCPQQLSETWKKNLWSPHSCIFYASKTNSTGLLCQVCQAVWDGSFPLWTTLTVAFIWRFFFVCFVFLLLFFLGLGNSSGSLSLISWKLTWMVFCPKDSIVIVVMHPR